MLNNQSPQNNQKLLTKAERFSLLKLARQAIEYGLRRERLPKLEIGKLSSSLREYGASFVTLTCNGELRGCVGTLEAYQPLADDVREHALAAAFQDYRFPSLRANELSSIRIEISRLTPPQDLEYETPEELIEKLQPSLDGVTLIDGSRRATFLPQVWQKIDRPDEFLDHLCVKMGANPDLWRNKNLRVQTYRVEEFHE
jgi:AmmeMemoRadiSam system protein A